MIKKIIKLFYKSKKNNYYIILFREINFIVLIPGNKIKSIIVLFYFVESTLLY